MSIPLFYYIVSPFHIKWGRTFSSAIDSFFSLCLPAQSHIFLYKRPALFGVGLDQALLWPFQDKSQPVQVV